MFNFFLNNKGASIIEIVIALGIFALMASSFAVILVGSFSGILRGGEFLQAESLAQEAETAIFSIKKRVFNELVYNESSVVSDSGYWELSGEGDSYEEDGFLRQIYFYDVYRAVDGAYAEEGDSGAFNDLLSKKVLIKISWQSGNKNLSIERELLISSW
jgi:type II secretory pathway pseudopilin PulG